MDTTNLFKSHIYQTGLAAIVLSFCIFCLPFIPAFSKMDSNGLFIINYLIAVIYFFTLWFTGKLRKKNGGIYFFFLFLVLFLISAYSLNREIDIFKDSANWLCAMLIMCCVNYAGFAAFEKMPLGIKKTMCFILGISTAIFLYLSIYLVPLYAIGLAFSFALGLTLHCFVPLLFFIFTIKLIRRVSKENKSFLYRFFAAVIFAIIVTTTFTMRWVATSNALNKHYAEASKQPNSIPAWVYASQHASNNAISIKILKAGLVYSIPSKWSSNNLFSFMPSRSLGEKTKHDPLIMTAALFSATPIIPEEERINILKVLADARHKTQERLWNGDDLITKHISTIAQVWPSMHIAYTEKTVTVKNNDNSRWQNTQQEAIYTFQLPEGSVVTALSLWINNKEEKAILTTKEKATTAYKTIVGVERRDPSVLHWQEGNTVSVRVFPVLANEERKFKIGVTSPLPVVGGNLVYNNITFQGPATASTTETVNIIFEHSPADFITATALQQSGSKNYSYTGKYNPNWGLAWKDEGLKPAAFSFNGSTYLLKPYIKRRAFTTINTVYLDVNKSWSENDLQTTYSLLKGKQVVVYNNGFKKLNDTNLHAVCSNLQKLQYSLFPFHAIANDSTSIVITKSGDQSATLDDLKDSPFYSALKNTACNRKIKVFNLGEHPSTYLGSLREMRMFDYEHGDAALLKELINNKYFAADIETDNLVVLHDANLAILKDSGSMVSNAPDHLMRLFAYNHVMHTGGKTFLDGKIMETDCLVAEAKQANIVTPISSLIVLEKQKDYEQFDIEKNQNGLQNASVTSKGAVPEPHEWALIILVLSIAIYLKKKEQLSMFFMRKS